MRVLLVAVLAVTLVACSTPTAWPPDEHIVRRGETLFTIAWRYNKDPDDLARWNRLGDGSLIYPGQVLRLTPAGGSSAACSRASSGRRSSAPPPFPSGSGSSTAAGAETLAEPAEATTATLDLADQWQRQRRIWRKTGHRNGDSDRRPGGASYHCRGLRPSRLCRQWTDRLRAAYYRQT